MKPKKIIICITFVVFLLSLPICLYSQENDNKEKDSIGKQKYLYHSKGDMSFSINLGVFFPLFMLDLSDGSTSAVNTKTGGHFSAGWDIYLTPRIRVGAQVSPCFAYTPNYVYYIVPVLARGIYEIQPIKKISIPLYFGAGIAFTSYQDFYKVDFMLKPGFGVYYNWDIQWSFGIDVNYWWLIEFDKDRSNNRAASFLEVSASVFYHF